MSNDLYNRHWKEYTNPDFIGVYSFLTEENGQVKATPRNLTISAIAEEIVTGDGGKKDKKITVSFKEEEKRMIFNATNSKAMVKHFGDLCMFPRNWVGKSITINAVKVVERGQKEWRMQITGKGETAPAAKPDMTPAHPRWEGAKKAIADGTTTVEQIRKSFNVSPENEALLTAKPADDAAIQD